MEKQEILSSFLKNLESKKFENDFQRNFWFAIAPDLDEKVLESLNRLLIDEKMNKLKI